ncbi:MAG TPA: FAD-dependent oxidoreductase [Ornithinibacter sp.]|nr:FAD-dependent oxidoreductase [Ornithinibacter sp.]
MTRVVLVGGGYVTVHACAALAHRLRRPIARGDVEVVVLTADPCHHFHGFTGEVLAGILPIERTRTPLALACPQARVVHARVTRVDRGRRTVTYEPVTGEPEVELRWDHLVIGAGSREPAARVPGLAEHGFTLRGLGDIERLAARVAALRPGPADPVPTVVVAGGGIAGVELAAAVADRGHGLVRVELVQAGPTLVPELTADQPRLARRVVAELDRLGVVVHTGTRLVEVTPTGALLSDGRVVATTTVIGTIGQRPVPLPGLGDGLRDLQGRLTTAPDLSVVDGVWAAGDAARVTHPATGDPVPANALWAIKAGHHVGVNVSRSVRHRPTRRFRYRGLGRAASFGLGRSVSELYGIPFTGWVAWLLRLVFFLRFMPSRRQALLTAADTVRAVAGRRVTATAPAGHAVGDTAVAEGAAA